MRFPHGRAIGNRQQASGTGMPSAWVAGASEVRSHRAPIRPSRPEFCLKPSSSRPPQPGNALGGGGSLLLSLAIQHVALDLPHIP
jgi:hypothetical protein